MGQDWSNLDPGQEHFWSSDSTSFLSPEEAASPLLSKTPVLVHYLPICHKLGSSQKREPQLRKRFRQISTHQVQGAFSRLFHVGGLSPTINGTIPAPVVLGCIGKQLRKQNSPCLHFSSCLQVLALTSLHDQLCCDINRPFSPRVAVCPCSCRSSREMTQDSVFCRKQNPS